MGCGLITGAGGCSVGGRGARQSGQVGWMTVMGQKGANGWLKGQWMASGEVYV